MAITGYFTHYCCYCCYCNCYCLQVWVCYSAITGYIIYLCTQKKLAATTPRKVRARARMGGHVNLVGGHGTLVGGPAPNLYAPPPPPHVTMPKMPHSPASPHLLTHTSLSPPSPLPYSWFLPSLTHNTHTPHTHTHTYTHTHSRRRVWPTGSRTKG